jgi:hypothetical protein
MIVVGCDSSGSIGSKALDLVKCPSYVVGRFAARVALMETISTGAKPICLAAPLAVEPIPTGKNILRGIRDEVKYAGLNTPVPIVNSTEKNFKTRETGAGVTVVGIVEPRALRIGRCRSGDEVFALGVPRVGGEVLRAERRHIIADLRDVITLIKYGSVHEVIPVGSKGIIHETRVLAKDSHLQFRTDRHAQGLLTKSAGPATVLLFAGNMRGAMNQFRKPVRRIGVFTG